MHEQTIAKLIAEEILRERRRARRSGWLKLSLILLLVLAIAVPAGMLLTQMKPGANGDKPYAAFVRIQGEIAPDAEANAEAVISALRGAFDDKDAKGVVIAINSPGGTPVQSAMIYKALLRLRRDHPDKPVLVVGEDVLASGAYYVAAAADRIIVNEATLAGSIGVVYRGFGFSDALARLGIERRVVAAGESKNMGDPFSPMSDKERSVVLQALSEVHEQFKRDVRAGRAGRLKGDESELFSGAVFTGTRAVELGLADATGSLPWVAYDELKVERLREYAPRKSLLHELVGRFARASVQAFVADAGMRLQ